MLNEFRPTQTNLVKARLSIIAFQTTFRSDPSHQLRTSWNDITPGDPFSLDLSLPVLICCPASWLDLSKWLQHIYGHVGEHVCVCVALSLGRRRVGMCWSLFYGNVSRAVENRSQKDHRSWPNIFVCLVGVWYLLRSRNASIRSWPQVNAFCRCEYLCRSGMDLVQMTLF